MKLVWWTTMAENRWIEWTTLTKESPQGHYIGKNSPISAKEYPQGHYIYDISPNRTKESPGSLLYGVNRGILIKEGYDVPYNGGNQGF